MAIKRMLVDATHPEETRIVVTSGNKLEEFDFESATRRQLRGNIYLAKVTRVEPSLQAAFVEYGGNRHGFLAFSEIHPDYYQIPVADREALLAAQLEEEQQDSDDDVSETASNAPEDDSTSEEDGNAESESDDDDNGDASANASVESVGADEDALEEIPQRKKSLAKRYKIQEVIKRRQVILIQVVKEERGNKGAALTTYLSLAGRYSVLMPNTARGGGISRKITNSGDRKRLKEIVGDLKVPEGMGIILRTAGASRTKAEVKRDFEYLLRLWENVRNLTLKSQAPALVYEEGSLIKRTIRDLYNKDIDEVWVAGDEAYREAKDFMRMIMPSHAKNVQAYKNDQQIFSKYNIENQLDAMFSPEVTLPSGGYIVINPTEALVSIDVNSGRSTKEHNIEDTAYQTNLEAADEVARQLRLRDLAGLIVIDFIDMMEKRSIRNVERRLKDALRNDRARIQVGRISHFGLMEMSRQRMRFGVLESSTHVCPTCAGAGIVRAVESLALMVMRAIEEHVLKRPGNSIDVRMPMDVALYILNAKRSTLNDLEVKYGLTITISADSTLQGSNFSIDKGETRATNTPARPAISVDTAQMIEIAEDNADEESSATSDESDGSERPRRRRRRGGRNRNRRDHENHDAQSNSDENASENTEAEGSSDAAPSNGPADDENSDEPRKRRRRGRRGGRRNRRDNENGENHEGAQDDAKALEAVEGHPVKTDDESVSAASDLDDRAHSESAPAAETAPEAVTEEAPVKKPRRTRRKKTTSESADTSNEAKAPKDNAAASAEAAKPAPDVSEPVADPAPAPKKKPRRTKKPAADDGIIVTSSTAPEKADEEPKRGGWWQKTFNSKR